MAAPISDNAGIRHSMRPHRFMWRFCGFLPLPNDRSWYPIYAGLMNFNRFIFIGFIVLSVSEAQSVADCVQVLLLANTFVLLVVKAAIFRWNFARLERTFDLMQELEVTTQRNCVERRMLRNCAQWSHRMLVLISVLSYFGLLSNALVPLMEGEQLIYPSMYPFNWRANRGIYYATFLYQFASNSFFSMYFTTVDVYGPCMYLHLATYVRILCGRMERLGTRADGGQRALDNRQELIECVKYHKMCLRLANELNDLFGVHFAIQFSSSSFILCVAAYQTSMTNPIQRPIDFMFCVMYVAALATELYLPCICGSLVLEGSNDLSRSLYRSNWIPQCRVFKSIMSVYMERSQSAITLYIYREFASINLGAFVSITRGAYSLLTFLQSF